MAQLTIQQAYDLGLRHYQAGEFPEAEGHLRRVLGEQPRHAGALHCLGIIAARSGRNALAADLIQRAIAIRSNYPEAHTNLGNVLMDMGRIEEAIAAHRRAIALSPGFSAAFVNLGNALKAAGRLDEAVAAYRHALVLNPSFPESHSCLGSALREAGKLDEAIAAHRQAVVLRPGYADGHINLGNALKDKGQLDEAIAAYRHAIALQPNHAVAHGNLGIALKDKGRLDEAIAVYRRAVELKPDFSEALVNLGNALNDKGEPADAMIFCRRAIALRPGYPEAHVNLGNSLQALRRLDEAVSAYRQAISLNPRFAEAFYNLGTSLSEMGQLDEAMAAYRKTIALKPEFAPAHYNLGNALKDTGQPGEAVAAYRQAIALGYDDAWSNLALTQYYDPHVDARAIAEEHRRWDRQHVQPLGHVVKPYLNDREPDRRLKVGYVSPDLRNHPVGRFLMPLFQHHDHERVEVFCYSNAAAPDDMTASLREKADCWREISSVSDGAAAAQIRDDRIDILVDLAGHTARNRLMIFARKPAPVQVTYLAYPGSSGLGTMDYRLSDPWLDPIGSALDPELPGENESLYIERTVRLPETYWCYRPPVDAQLSLPPTLESGFITFGCLNNFCKVNEPLLSLWARILAAVPRSRLILHAHQGSHRQRVIDLLQRQGVEPQRVTFFAKVPMAAYLASYHGIDIALDTVPYGGGATTCDALWMGVPVVSLAGKTAVGRGGLSILSNIGLPELVARTSDDYIRLAAGLANDLPRLKELRSTLRQRMENSPLMDAPKFARSIEAAYRQMWRSWCATA